MKSETIIINSSLLYTLAFVIVFLIHELGLVLAGLYLKLDPLLYHNTMSFRNITDPAEYIAFGAGPFLALITGSSALIVMKFSKTLPPVMKLFLVWLAMNGISLFLIQMPVIPFSEGGDLTKFTIAVGAGETVKFILAAIGIILIITIGIKAVKYFLSFAESGDEISSIGGRRMFILKIALIPWLFGALFCMPFRVPPFSVHYLLLPFVNGQAIVWTLIGAAPKVKIETNGFYFTSRETFSLFGMLIILFLFFQIVLSNGLKF